MDLQLVKYNDPILTQPTKLFDFKNPPFDPAEFAESLAQLMIIKDGLGLAANQVGQPYRIFAIAIEPAHVCFNPEVLDYSEESVTLEEGCLSYPGLIVKVTRPKSIKVRFTHPNGETVTKTYTGMTARIMLHEIQHLDGERFFDQVNWYEKEKVKKYFKKLKRNERNNG